MTPAKWLWALCFDWGGHLHLTQQIILEQWQGLWSPTIYVQRIWESFCQTHVYQCREVIFINSTHKVKHFPGSYPHAANRNVKRHRFCLVFGMLCHVLLQHIMTGKFSGKPIHKSNRRITLWSTAYPGNITITTTVEFISGFFYSLFTLQWYCWYDTEYYTGDWFPP